MHVKTNGGVIPKLDQGGGILFKDSKQLIFHGTLRHDILVLITLASSQGSDQPAHSHNLARAFAARTQREII